MELSPKQQINELIKTSKNILIVSHSKLNGDALGSMLALEKVLTKLEKEVSIVTSEKTDDPYSFLPGLEKLKNNIAGTRDFIVRINTEKTPLEKLSYSQEDKFVNVVISPKNGKIDPKDLELSQGNFKFDLIFVLDTPNVDKIDKVYDRETELFLETPIVNVDHHEGNEYFGTVNLVDMTATSTCEILVSIIESFGAGHFDEDVATCLLTGIITDTESYKKINTTPKSLTISAQMLAAGARQQEIINNLYKAHSFDSLKLIGKILSKLEYNNDLKVSISALSREDLGQIELELNDLRAVSDDIFLQIPNSDVLVIIFETKTGKVSGIIKSFTSIGALEVISRLGGRGDSKSAEFEISGLSLKSALNQIVANIAEKLGKSFANNSPVEEKAKEEIQTKNEVVNKTREYLVEATPTESDSVENIMVTFPEDPISKAIESIDQEIDNHNENLANIDIDDAKSKDEPLKPLGNILESHKPGTALDSVDEQPPISKNETNGLGNKNERIETWKSEK